MERTSYVRAATLPEMFGERCKRTPDAEAYRQYERDAWVSYTWGEMGRSVGHWKAALHREGLQRGERVAIMARNCVEWVCFDQAALSLGLVVVPLYTNDNPGSIAYILGNSGARVLLVENEERWVALAQLRDQFPLLQRAVALDASLPDASGLMRPLREWLGNGTDTPQLAPSDPDSLATIIYTSGTTGKPKGVMLSHRNILSNAEAVLQVVEGFAQDVYLSFLPLSHALERTVGYYVPIVTGSAVAFARSVQDLPQDLLAVRPTMLVSVPRVYERVYARLQQRLQDEGVAARALFAKAEEIGWHRFEAGQHRSGPTSAAEDVAWLALRRIVAAKMLERLGGRLRIAVSGGAPISQKLTHCLIGLGLPLLQGYGLTEAAPIVSANTLEDNVPTSVGRPVPGVEVRIGSRNEILVRGPNVMLGYWDAPEKTAETLDEGGWLHTGDVGRIDTDGHLYIVGRLKEILVTSTGEKLPPSDIELAITGDPLFEQVMVIGENRPYVAAVAVLNPESWLQLSRELRVPPDADSLEHERVHAAALDRIRRSLEAFPSYAQVRRVALSLEPWTTDNGLITPTMKLRRKQLEVRFAGEISRLYESHATPA